MENTEDRLRAFCSITFDHCFVVRDLKIIEGNNGPFVAMPSRKLSVHCRWCNTKNHMRARFCNQCGKRCSHDRFESDDTGRARLYADIAHPINAECRERIQSHVVHEFQQELERAKNPDYVSRYDDDYPDAHRGQETARTDPPQPVGGPHISSSEQDTVAHQSAAEETREFPAPKRRKTSPPDSDSSGFGSGLY